MCILSGYCVMGLIYEVLGCWVFEIVVGELISIFGLFERNCRFRPINFLELLVPEFGEFLGLRRWVVVMYTGWCQRFDAVVRMQCELYTGVGVFGWSWCGEWVTKCRAFKGR